MSSNYFIQQIAKEFKQWSHDLNSRAKLKITNYYSIQQECIRDDYDILTEIGKIAKIDKDGKEVIQDIAHDIFQKKFFRDFDQQAHIYVQWRV